MHRLVSFLLLGLALFAASTAVAQRNLKDIPDPDPEEERKTFVVADGFEVNLFAADPLLAKPIQMNFDAKGRLWVASSEVYPHIKPGQKANDKILILEDKNNDGKADTTQVFADGLLIPTGVIPGDGGAYVANSTELIHLRDTDGDGKSDMRNVVLSGFGSEDTHHLLHTLRWGPDGCLYMNQSIYIHSHIETPYGVKRLNGGGIWRFRPETQELDIVCRGFVNPWGHHFDKWGQQFATDGAYGEGVNYVFPGAIYVTAPGEKRRLRGLHPGSPKHCGLEILSGGHLPEDVRGDMITNDFRAHRVCRFTITEAGAGYASRQQTELIKSRHVAFRPIDVKMGPDGAIYIADWYNPIIQHGEVDFRDPRRDHVHGRIWRITAKGRALTKKAEIEGASTAALLQHLKAEEQWVRLFAKLELKSRPKSAVLKALTTWLDELDQKDPAAMHHKLEALWLYECLRHPEPELLSELLISSDHRIRAAAIRTLSHWRKSIPAAPQRLANAVRDEHPRVRLEAVRALAEIPRAASARQALMVLDQPMDRFLDFALWQAMRDLKEFWLPEVAAGRMSFEGKPHHLTFALKAVESPGIVAPLLDLLERDKKSASPDLVSLIATLGDQAALQKLFNSIASRASDLPSSEVAAALRSLSEAALARNVRPADTTAISQLLRSKDNQVVEAALLAAGAWKTAAAEIESFANDRSQPEGTQLAAIRAMGMSRTKDSIAALVKISAGEGPGNVRLAAIEALAPAAPVAAAKQIVALLKSQDGESNSGSTAALSALLARKPGAPALVAALKDQSLPADAAREIVQAANAAGRPLPAVVQAARTAGKLDGRTWQKLSPEDFAAIVADVATQGDAARGEAVYRRRNLQCVRCHAIGGAGGNIGPDLISVGASAQVDYLLESIVNPAKKVKENFHSKLIETEEGELILGIPVRETAKELLLRDADGKEHTIAIDDIAGRTDGRSLMPDGLVDSLTRRELVDLVRFMSELGKSGDYALAKQRYIRSWQSLVWTSEGHRRLNRTSFDTAGAGDPALTWRAETTRVSGELPLDDLATFQPHRDIDPTCFVRAFLNVQAAGTIGLRINDVKGVTMWLNGKPAIAKPEMEVAVQKGRQMVTFAVNKKLRQTPFRVELFDVPGQTLDVEIVSSP